jgi:arginyl-tRNA synthetase
MSFVLSIKEAVQVALQQQYQKSIAIDEILINETKPEFIGDYTLVTFAFSKLLGKKPDDIAHELGATLMMNNELFQSYNVIKGFLNLELKSTCYVDFLNRQYANQTFGNASSNGKKVMVEYSSPNTNKPLHFGHLRNIFLGYALSNLLKVTGHEVIKANLINDRGIHICKSMIAWQLYANGATPESTGIKGDHMVGDYYVKFNDVYKEQVAALKADGVNEDDSAKQAPIMQQAQELLRKWEDGDPETMRIWTMMNNWVYAGFKVSYERLGVDFDQMYYESNTYLSGKDVVKKGLSDGVLFQKEDGSVWIDLTDDGLDQKLLLRGDGTSVYMTQDIGTAILKYSDYKMDSSIYVIGDEQNYHMQVLKLILKKLGEPFADGVYHLSYGMVELPSGKMKSREGTVVDADDMMDEMISIAQKNTEELGKVDGFSTAELQKLYATLGMGALKFYLLRVDPKKKMIFNPEESIDFHGFTGPFVQYTHARISSILRKAEGIDLDSTLDYTLTAVEMKMLRSLEQFPSILIQAAKEYNPAMVSNTVYQVAKEFNSFLVDHSILKADTEGAKITRIKICQLTQHVISFGLNILGIDAPHQM